MKKDIDTEKNEEYTSEQESDAFQLLDEYLVVVKEWEKHGT